MIRTIVLHDMLADKFGNEPFKMDVDTPKMLFRALISRFKGLRQEISKGFEYSLVMKIGQDFVPVTVDEYELTFGVAEEIHIIPVVVGAGATAIAYIATTLSVSTVTATIIYIAATVAVSMVMGAIIKSLSPQPNISGSSGGQDPRASHIFNGPENVVTQGGAIPIVYGVHMTGSIVVSASIDVGDVYAA
jgi:predicted phage tail protein